MTAHVDLTDLASDLRLLSEVAGRLARHLENGVADLANVSPARTVTNGSDDDKLIGASGLAELLCVDVRTLRRMRHENRAPKPLTRDPLRWRRSDVDRWIEERAA